MPQSLVKNLVHIVFSTKNRIEFLRDNEIRKELYAYMATIFKSMDSPALLIGGATDHLHVLSSLSKTECIANLVGEAKRKTSKWLKTKGGVYVNFYWQNGYCGFSIGKSEVEQVKKYIASQVEHHYTETFQDELRRLFMENDIGFDERYIWD